MWVSYFPATIAQTGREPAAKQRRLSSVLLGWALDETDTYTNTHKQEKVTHNSAKTAS